jgi:8-oxo-dGTP pyrophosphatase MutT (NUDIX family)
VGPWERRSRRTAYGVPFAEDPLAGARRELVEETGYRATTWRELLRHSLTNSISDEEGVVYLETGRTPDSPEPEPTEDIHVRQVPFDDALAMVDRGEIHDAVTQLALLAAARALGR